VIRDHHALMLVPVAQFFVLFALLGGYLGLCVIFLQTPTDSGDATSALVMFLAAIAGLFVATVTASLVATYFRAVLMVGADEALRGVRPTPRSMFGTVNSRFGRLAQWSVLQALVGLFLNALSRSGAGGVVGAAIGNAAWRFVTFLAVPVVVHEGVGPIETLKRSGRLLRQTWGENLSAKVGFGLLGALVVAPGLGLFALSALVVDQSTALGVTLVVAGFVWLLVGASFIGTLSAVYAAALYRYAVDAAVPVAFVGAGIESAFTTRTHVRGRVLAPGV